MISEVCYFSSLHSLIKNKKKVNKKLAWEFVNAEMKFAREISFFLLKYFLNIRCPETNQRFDFFRNYY
jgi:hypothetical protein